MNYILLFLLLIIFPYIIGYGVNNKTYKSNNLIFVYLQGYLTMFSIFWIIVIPIVLYDSGRFNLVIIIYSAILSILLGYSIYLLCKNKKKQVYNIHISKQNFLYLTVFWALVIFQLYHSIFYVSFDGDDAYYVTISTIANQENIMYAENPYLGWSWKQDLSHTLAPFPIWIAYISRITNLHTAFICHSILPIIFIPLTYGAYYIISTYLFNNNKDRYIFMIFIAILQMFGNISIYTNETFLLTRTWQGKSIYSNLMILCTSIILLDIYKKKNVDKSSLILLFMVNLSSCLTTLMAAIISPLFIFIFALIYLYRTHNPKQIFLILCTTLPFIIDIVLYKVGKI